jgi:hypothetical protein
LMNFVKFLPRIFSARAVWVMAFGAMQGAAFAQSQSGTYDDLALNGNILDLAFVSMEGALIGQGLAMASGVSGITMAMCFSLGVIAIVLGALEFAKENAPDVAMQNIVEVIVWVAIFSTIALNNSLYGSLVGQFKSMFQAITASYAGSLISPGSTAWGPLFVPFQYIGASILNLPWQFDVAIIAKCIFTLLVLLYALYKVVMLIIQAVKYYLLSALLVAMAVALGPLCLAAGVWEKTRDMFTKWLDFFMIALFYKVLVIVMLLIYASAFKAATAGMWNIDGLLAISSVIIIAILAEVGETFFSMLPEIASAILPGRLKLRIAESRGSGSSAGGGAPSAVSPGDKRDVPGEMGPPTPTLMEKHIGAPSIRSKVQSGLHSAGFAGGKAYAAVAAGPVGSAVVGAARTIIG